MVASRREFHESIKRFEKEFNLIKESSELNEDSISDGYNSIGNFWVVTTPSEDSVIEDICFETNIPDLIRQAHGGLNEEDIVLATKLEDTANSVAQRLLKIRDIKRSRNVR